MLLRILPALCLLILTESAFSATPALRPLRCGVGDSHINLRNSIGASLQLLPSLEADVENCFHPQRVDYKQKTYEILAVTRATYQENLAAFTTGVQRLQNGGSASEFESTLTTPLENLKDVHQTIEKYEGRLRRYGFTTSDIMDDGNYRYPNCNSQKNNQPEAVWAQFYQNVQALERERGIVINAITCLKAY